MSKRDPLNITATIGKFSILKNNKGIEASFTFPLTKQNVDNLFRMRPFYVRLQEPLDNEGNPRGNKNATEREYADFTGEIEGIVIPKVAKKDDQVGKGTLHFMKAQIVVESLYWITSCDPAEIVLLQTQEELPADDGDDEAEDQEELETE